MNGIFNMLNNADKVPEKNEEKQPIFVSRKMLDEMKNHLPYELYDQLEVKFELGFMHAILGDKNYKEEVETIMKAKRATSNLPVIEYKLKHK